MPLDIERISTMNPAMDAPNERANKSIIVNEIVEDLNLYEMGSVMDVKERM